jgi:hypothetical protein
MINPSQPDSPIEVNGKRGFNLTETGWGGGGLIWYTHGSKTNIGTGAGVYCHGTR